MGNEPVITARTRTRKPASVTPAPEPAAPAYKYGDPTKPLWEIIAKHKLHDTLFYHSTQEFHGATQSEVSATFYSHPVFGFYNILVARPALPEDISADLRQKWYGDPTKPAWYVRLKHRQSGILSIYDGYHGESIDEVKSLLTKHPFDRHYELVHIQPLTEYFEASRPCDAGEAGLP